MLHDSLVIAAYVLLVLINAVGVGMVALQLPGTWLILIASGAVAWWRQDTEAIGIWTIVAVAALAVLGELVEFAAGAWGAQRAGASKRAVILATVTAVFGAIAGTFLIPVPVAGTLIGAVLGAGLGSVVGDKWAGREWAMAMEAGKGAAIGRFWGALGKIAVAVTMWGVVLVAILW